MCCVDISDPIHARFVEGRAGERDGGSSVRFRTHRAGTAGRLAGTAARLSIQSRSNREAYCDWLGARDKKVDLEPKLPSLHSEGEDSLGNLNARVHIIIIASFDLRAA
jgi:hypothetical protein